MAKTRTFNRNWTKEDNDEWDRLSGMQREQSTVVRIKSEALFKIPELKQTFKGIHYYDYSDVRRIAEGLKKTQLGARFLGELEEFIKANRNYSSINATKQKLTKKYAGINAPVVSLTHVPPQLDCVGEAKAVELKANLNIDQIQLMMDQLSNTSGRFKTLKTEKEAELTKITGQLEKEIDKLTLAEIIINEKRDWYRSTLQMAKTAAETERRIEEWESANRLEDVKISIVKGVEPVKPAESTESAESVE
jgi:hypothetical protein